MTDTAQWNGNSCQLGEIMDIGLGGVTGDAHYFLLTETERLKRKLPVACLRPVLSKARHLIDGEMTEREWKTLLQKGERVWLFDPQPHLLRHPAVHAYLDLDSEAGGCHRDRHKIRERSLWYRTTLPRRIDGFISGMTRLGPWISLRTMPGLTANNTLYTVRFRASLSQDEQAAWALSLLTSRTRESVKSVGRIYPDGLTKYEPRDLADIPLMIPQKMRGAKARYLEAIEALLGGDEKKCQAMADNWFATQKKQYKATA